MLLQRELFLTMLYTINSSSMLVTKSVFKLICVLSNYQTCTFPLNKLSPVTWYSKVQCPAAFIRILVFAAFSLSSGPLAKHPRTSQNSLHLVRLQSEPYLVGPPQHSPRSPFNVGSHWAVCAAVKEGGENVYSHVANGWPKIVACSVFKSISISFEIVKKRVG